MKTTSSSAGLESWGWEEVGQGGDRGGGRESDLGGLQIRNITPRSLDFIPEDLGAAERF